MKKSQYCTVFFILLIFGAQACATTNVAPTPTKTSGNIVISTFTAAPTDAPTPSPAPTTDSRVKGKIPGISPVNVTVSLEDQKFTCTTVKKQGSNYKRTCTRGVPAVEVFSVVISGSESFVVDHIEASVLQYENPDTQVAASILGLVASMPYDGATPEEAKAWVESSIPVLSAEPGGSQEMMFGGVKYLLYGPPTALTLEMGELP